MTTVIDSIDGKVGVALLSFAHVHARDYANQVKNHPECKIMAVWDEDRDRGLKEAAAFEAPFYDSLEAVLDLPEVNAVVVNAPTYKHREVIVAAAQAGKHIFTEKSLTINTEDATEVMRAVEDSGVRFAISLPSRVRPEILFAKQILDMGYLGEVTQMRARIAHTAALDRWFAGLNRVVWKRGAGGRRRVLRSRVSSRGCDALVSGNSHLRRHSDDQFQQRLRSG